MNIKKYYLTKNINTRRIEDLESVKKIVLTSSKYPRYSALKNRNVIEKYKYSNDIMFSCHYIIGTSGEILNIIPEREKAICTGNDNIDSISISIMLGIDKNGKYSEQEIHSLEKLLLSLKTRYNIENEDVILEYDINNSRRPKNIVDEPIILDEILKK